MIAMSAQSCKPVALASTSLRPKVQSQRGALKSVNAGHLKVASPFMGSMAVKAPKATRIANKGTVVVKAADDKVVVIGLAADSGCGKSTFMRRPRSQRQKRSKGDRLAPESQNFDLMYEQVKALKSGQSVDKPIYNHVTGLLDPPEKTEAPKILIIEGLHPFYDDRVNDLIDFRIYLDISDEIKFAWKIQRDMAERGHSLESIKASIDARKPDFDAYIDPQKKKADVIIEVLPTQLIPDEKEGKVLRVRLIQKEGKELFSPSYLFDEGSTVSWIPCGRKLTCSFPGIKVYYGPDTYYGEEVSVLEMDGQFDKLEELIYLESHLSSTSAKFYGEITQQMMKNNSFPGSNNGTGLFQTIVGLKVREVYERITEKEVTPV
eukprot:jgi/Picre1/29370/NNA_004760.t1